ncbi:P-loop containing nucleoside triphosphate hydrolase protein [Anaeromyces robustus]|uniref:p-loop containing nucleoside triphosphate hydrolase protein n=1 Tax=Anaeromyces robustus TaxID=1754192 RepID=A0A1Y1W709_9FUNG|nr:P-loop containing nucleoside triphosphate hydrolase protein [Anaeromyces robustus]|eukprot:ORX69333.1 P-loop containing nucleoside triphosphate hydrolase protein [Anaeromyces robustus]
MASRTRIKLSEEQSLFIKEALLGKNILVDACIGSGKTTAIQKLCNKYDSNKNILYLTYNKLLKIDAKTKIRKKNILVQNYHGFAYIALNKIEKKPRGQSILIQEFLNKRPKIPIYDVLIIDEYQDIYEEASELLKYIKSFNPSMQIIAVGDMEQKIYDYTILDVISFMKDFLEDYIKLEFTKCFRLSEDIASMLGRIWHKKIVGVNEKCIVEEMDINKTISLLSKQRPSDILCLGKSRGQRDILLNKLESKYPKKFNKNTVYAKISDNESSDGSAKPNSNSAIFTTYDSSKGLEKKICVLCDFTEKYWSTRMEMPNNRYEILRNIFCVAASRGKERIIFLKPNNDNDENSRTLSEKTLSTYISTNHNFKNFEMSTMFDYKYKEDIKKCFEQLKIEKIEREDTSIISINSLDGLIDLSPCIGNYQEAMFFNNYNINKAIQSKLCMEEINKQLNKPDNKYTSIEDIEYLEYITIKKVSEKYEREISSISLDEKILYMTSLDTKQERYKKQVKVPFVSEVQRNLIENRIKTLLNKNEKVQVECKIYFAFQDGEIGRFRAIGYCDVIKDDIVYELKFVSELVHEHFLQCACYMISLGLEKGILWNTKDNTMYCITIPNKKTFLDNVVRTITKGIIKEYYDPFKDIYQYDDNNKLISITSRRAIHEYRENRKQNNKNIDEVLSYSILKTFY